MSHINNLLVLGAVLAFCSSQVSARVMVQHVKLAPRQQRMVPPCMGIPGFFYSIGTALEPVDPFQNYKEQAAKSYPNCWNRGRPSPADMAKAGLKYSGRCDEVECSYCGLVLDGWKADHDPTLRHLHARPDCPFLTRQNAKGAVAVAASQSLCPGCQKPIDSGKADKAVQTPVEIVSILEDETDEKPKSVETQTDPETKDDSTQTEPEICTKCNRPIVDKPVTADKETQTKPVGRTYTAKNYQDPEEEDSSKEEDLSEDEDIDQDLYEDDVIDRKRSTKEVRFQPIRNYRYVKRTNYQ